MLRQGRFTPAQQRAFDEQWPRFGLDYTGTPRDFDAAFGRNAPRVLEIGFGNGEALRYAAARDPDRDLIGIEVHAPGVGRLLNALAADDARNVRLYHHDAVEVLQHEIADASLDEVRIYFPDPWHKKRHNKRRLVNPAFAALLVRKLAPTGRLHLATDWQDYAEQMWDVLDATPGLANRAGPRGTVPRARMASADAFRDARPETRAWRVGSAVRRSARRRRARGNERVNDTALMLTTDMKLVLGLVGFTMVMFLFERIRADVVALVVLVLARAHRARRAGRSVRRFLR